MGGMDKDSLRSFTHVLFDLDGTLVESGPGIIASARFALESFGIREDDDANLRRFIGPPLMDSFRDFYGFSDEMARRAMAAYRVRYAETGIFECAVYDGIPEALERLRSSGVRLHVATSKPAPYMERILVRFGLSEFFDGRTGSDLSEGNAAKPRIVARAISSAGIGGEAAAGRVAMAGDRRHDVEGARANGIPALGCLWGYGSREELSAAGADFILERTGDLSLLV